MELGKILKIMMKIPQLNEENLYSFCWCSLAVLKQRDGFKIDGKHQQRRKKSADEYLFSSGKLHNPARTGFIGCLPSAILHS
jgi:hypothetical protein